MADVEAAAYALVHDYPGGGVALGAAAGVGSLNNKVNPNCDRNFLMLKESLRIQQVSGDHRVLFAEAEELGYALVKLPDVDSSDFATEATRTVKEFGDFIGKAGEVLADGKVSANELKAVERELVEAMAHMTQLHKLIAAKVSKR